MLPLIEKIAGTVSPAGFEYMSHEAWGEIIADTFDEVKYDIHGSIEMIKRADIPNAKRLMLDAHIDQTGFIVSEILDDGFVRIKTLGGMDMQVVIASVLRIYTRSAEGFTFSADRYIEAVAVSTPPHLKKDSDTLPDIDHIYLDTGYTAEALKKLICVGAPVTFEPRFMTLMNGLLTSPGLDDRICCAALLLAVRRLQKPLSYELRVTFTAGEEYNSLGARTSAYRIDPHAALVLDVNFAHDPGVDANESIEVGGGAGLSYSASTSIKLTKKIHEFAKEQKIKIQATAEPNDTGTNATAVAVTRAGVPCAVISIPLKNMHTPAETVSVADVDSAAELVASLIDNMII